MYISKSKQCSLAYSYKATLLSLSFLFSGCMVLDFTQSGNVNIYLLFILGLEIDLRDHDVHGDLHGAGQYCRH